MTPPPQAPCPFCRKIHSGTTTLENETSSSFPDAYPVSPGHTLIIPKRHVESLFTLTEAELSDIWRLVSAARQRITTERKPAGFNIGVNDGTPAGQTIPHAHVHLIPRYTGDQDDPRGGVRWIFPKQAKYW
ncbi:MAG: HIT family protein [Elusimicrobia bacterium CG_4_9_14_3_um_filter_62_55]|nr:MAG: HIT family protein [Elusimicrobia bacterium CG22_combo_CG10-13_8_21_14_all_63_91]PJA14695.1 MAG: HIT family protein [Elusimicrobia bacterium CG_4_10_14_0_2_um_filter_63_34]PJB25027.1 MAG: HIT family protein [Elusimicrobia bacterium CG_4_9_14_3_um_filter_62_55]